MKRIAYFTTAALLLFACMPEENNPNGRENPDNKTVHVTGITLDRTTVAIKEGEAITLTPTITPDNADNQNVSWFTSSETVAIVDYKGNVTGIKAGSATITVITEDGGKKATCALTVEANLAPSSTVGAEHISAISVVLKGKANLGSSVASDLKVGFQYSTSAGILPSNSTTVEATDADANYNYSAGVTGLEPDTKYYFRSFVRQNGQDTYGETKEFSTKELSSLLHSQEALPVSAISATLNADLNLTDVQYKKKALGFYWGTSTDAITSKVSASEGVGSVSTDLLGLTPSKQYYYQAYIVLDGKELKESVLSFTTKDLKSMLETKDASGIEAGSATLSAKLDLTDARFNSISYGFYWSTSETSQRNNLECWGIVDNAYTTTLTDLSHKTQYWYKAYAKLDNQTFYGEVKTFTTSIIKVGSVSLDTNEYTFNEIDNGLYLHATILPSDATDKSVTWFSDNENVATVDQNGFVRAIGNGTSSITVTTNDQGKTATCTITVAQLVTNISLNIGSLSLIEGEEVTLNPTITPNNAKDKSLTWTSSDESIATVNAYGKVLAKTKGKAVITALANDGSNVYATCSLTISSVCPPGAVDMDYTTSDGYKLYWATCNICETGFVSSPEEYGDYYAWGETKTKEDYSWPTYKWCNGSLTSLIKYNYLSTYGIVDNKTVLEEEDDVAHLKLGGKWRIPTQKEWLELLKRCIWKWTTQNGISGYLVTCKRNGNSIFLPATGAKYDTRFQDAGNYGSYWSSSLHGANPSGAWFVYFFSSEVDQNPYYRNNGRSVRPVSE